MGIFDFVTKAGSKLGGKIYDVTHDESDVAQSVEVSADRINELRAKSILDNINESDVIVKNLSVEVDGDKVTLGGKVNTQACCEKLVLIAGNQYGIGSVDCQIDVAQPEPESTMYTVKAGDTLSKIAKAQYGDAAKYMLIFEANKPMLTNPDKIYVGQNLRIPAAD